MPFTLALAQCAHPEDGDVLALVDEWTGHAAACDAQLIVFPECLMTPYEKTPEDFAAAAEPLDGPFVRAMCDLARKHRLWTLFTANERNPHGGAPYNTAVVVDDAGTVRASYRKVHLFDVGEYRESSKMSAGDRIFEPLDTPLCRLGMAICYDLRFPELARKQALAGCELLVYPAAWVAGPGKTNQWESLAKARAIENGMYVAALSRTGSVYNGHSLVVDPTGEVLTCGYEGEELLVCKIDPEKAAATRAAVPSLAHRRPELY